MSLKILVPCYQNQLLRPSFATSVSAGFPSPADDFIDKQLDLNDHLIYLSIIKRLLSM